MAQTMDRYQFGQKAQQIREQAASVLKRWGLLPRFKRWRLTQDPDTGMVVLFGILNNTYIATHTSTPFSDYFDPRLLHDLVNELQVQVVSCNSDGLRYAFVLDRGQVDVLPTHVDYPFLDRDRLFVRVVYDESLMESQITPAPLIVADTIDDHIQVRQGVEAFLKVFDDIKLRDDAALQLTAQHQPDIVVVGEDEFNQRVAEHEADRQGINYIRQLMGGDIEISKKMQQAISYALVNSGKLRRYRGGFWAMENWRNGQRPWFGTSTVKALVSCGLMSYTQWHEGRNGRFPIAAVVAQPPTEQTA